MNQVDPRANMGTRAAEQGPSVDGHADDTGERAERSTIASASSQQDDMETSTHNAKTGSHEAETSLKPTGLHTAMRGGTAPRAVLRPLPPGYPQPPRPTKPNRAPARPDASPPAPRPRIRGSVLLVLVLAGALVVAATIVGGVYGIQALRGPSGGPAPSGSPSSAAPSDPTPSGAAARGVEIGKVHVAEVSVETGIDNLAGHSPTGQFVVVTMEITNSSLGAIIVNDPFTLVTSDGERISPDAQATKAKTSGKLPPSLMEKGQSAQHVLVFDIPANASAVAMNVDLSQNGSDWTGTVSLS
ncbi:DUF4352 domain-containing protein [Brachybacterium timonense]|uniref:DUF4352 domain-containing protein n=1 Tax=Brachybacterium timonense TaxID=2050896 RepID=UPI000D0BC8F9|nr:DUF4352 domain-containing protein [Brachybacterium timonense]